MKLRHLTIALLTFAVAAFPAIAETVNYTPQALAAAQKSGKPVLVEITAPWCPTCKAQKPILSELTSQDKFKGFVIVDVDFDNQKDAVRSMKASSQSTLIVFKGSTEVGRSVGDTNRSSIEALLAKAL